MRDRKNLQMNGVTFDQQTIGGDLAFRDRHAFKVDVITLRFARLIDAKLYGWHDNAKIAAQLLAHTLGPGFKERNRHSPRKLSTDPHDNAGGRPQLFGFGSREFRGIRGLASALELFRFAGCIIELSRRTGLLRPLMPEYPVGSGHE